MTTNVMPSRNIVATSNINKQIATATGMGCYGAVGDHYVTALCNRYDLSGRPLSISKAAS